MVVATWSDEFVSSSPIDNLLQVEFLGGGDGLGAPLKQEGEGDGDVFGRIADDVEELTLSEAGGKARRFDTLCGNVQERGK